MPNPNENSVENKTQTNVSAITPQANSGELEEAQALTELNERNKKLEEQNKELLAAKKKYYDTVLNGQLPAEAPKERSAKEIREEMAKMKDKDQITNLDYAKLSIELDNAVIRETGKSSYLPKGKGVSPTADEKDAANRMHDFLEQAIEDADDDPAVFNQILQRHIDK